MSGGRGREWMRFGDKDFDCWRFLGTEKLNDLMWQDLIGSTSFCIILLVAQNERHMRLCDLHTLACQFYISES
ncbi:hypothetical protein M5689_002422 [Euphorbia peplus]|nr:hypothetical protein M5689_002422 [Euphorbia peplus]